MEGGGRAVVGLGAAEGGGGLRRGDDNDARGVAPEQLGQIIGSTGGENNPGEIEVQDRDQTHGRRGHPPLGVGVV